MCSVTRAANFGLQGRVARRSTRFTLGLDGDVKGAKDKGEGEGEASHDPPCGATAALALPGPRGEANQALTRTCSFKPHACPPRPRPKLVDAKATFH